MAIYNMLPVWGQNVACYIEGTKIKRARFGKDFWKFLAEYESRLKWTYEQLCDYRDAKLRKMVHHCYDTVPYYRRLFDDGGINPDNIKTLDDLKVLPILSKDVVNASPEDFLSTAISKDKMITAHTSGTTGSGFIFKTTKEAMCEQWAVWWRYRRALGIKFEMLCGQFGGRSVVPIACQHPPFFRWNSPCHMMYFSTYHMNDKNLPNYIKELREHNVRWIHGYPSSTTVLAEYLVNNGDKLPVEYVTLGAENLLEFQKKHIRKAFGVNAYQHYGMAEGVANFSENIDHIMRIDEDYAAVEFMPVAGTECFEIIGTSLTNFAMPFLRYRTNDVCEVAENVSGRIITALDGRKEDYVILPNGSKIGRLDHIFKDLTNIKEAQIVQKSKDTLEIRVVKNKLYADKDEQHLKQELALRLDGLKLMITYVDAIERTASGKLRFVKSEYNNEK